MRKKIAQMSLLDTYHSKVVIPINPRRGLPSIAVNFSNIGTPLCPKDAKPFAFHVNCGGRGRTKRLKFVYPGSLHRGTTMVNKCKSPCTQSSFGRCAYVYPSKNLRLYPGLSRDCEEFAQIYNHRYLCVTLHLYS